MRDKLGLDRSARQISLSTAILNRFLHHAEIITIGGRTYRLKDRVANSDGKNEKAHKDSGQAKLVF
jgi:hypothetical protein